MLEAARLRDLPGTGRGARVVTWVWIPCTNPTRSQTDEMQKFHFYGRVAVEIEFSGSGCNTKSAQLQGPSVVSKVVGGRLFVLAIE